MEEGSNGARPPTRPGASATSELRTLSWVPRLILV